ncbi:hypothetical protein B566_EDAN010788 [Ephemera danica]|nr:hypothetical protein B566_EDAN010788 [Ephemera danica]
MSGHSVIVKKRPKTKRESSTSVATLKSFSKEELISRIQQLEAHVSHLKNIIKKQTTGNSATCSKPSGKKGKRVFDFSRHHKRHVLLKLLYLGWDYQGYAVQENNANTVEHYLFQALTLSCLIEDRESSNYHRCGRTDKGVSAFCQVISIDLRSSLSPETENDLYKELPYCKILNSILPANIRAIAWRPARSITMSARFDCKSRTYHYYFPRGNINLVAMRQALLYLLGTHDFRNFCKMDVGNGVVDYTRSIFAADIEVCKPLHNKLSTNKCQVSAVKTECSSYDICVLMITGKAFLWHQIRCIVSVLFLIGHGKESPEIISGLLDPSVCPDKPQYPLASELPLCLFECKYEDMEKWFIDQEQHSRLVADMQAAWTANALRTQMTYEMLQELEKDISGDPVCQHGAELTLGVQTKVYQPLLSRRKCSSLANRIQHYVIRRKLEVVGSEQLLESTQSGEASTC